MASSVEIRGAHLAVEIEVPGRRGPTGPPGPPGEGVIDFEAAIESHIASPTPHPAYDDAPSLVLLFENGLM